MWDPHRNSVWDGKIGMWPIGDWVPAQRTSSKRAAGTLVWKDESVTRDVYRRMLAEKVVPAIIEKWPRREWIRNDRVIRIQQDGPNCHITPADEQFNGKLRELGVENIVLLYTQPANSPDLNINDLGFFRALQSSYLQYSPTNARELIEAVERTYREYPMDKINRIWLSLIGCTNCIIDCHGDNTYSIPHMNKVKLEQLGQLPISTYQQRRRHWNT